LIYEKDIFRGYTARHHHNPFLPGHIRIHGLPDMVRIPDRDRAAGRRVLLCFQAGSAEKNFLAIEN
jgi:hypothetical protein